MASSRHQMKTVCRFLKQFCSLRRLHSDKSRGCARTNHISVNSISKVIPKQPAVVTKEGKWVKLEGYSKPIVDFASNDIFGVQGNPFPHTVGNTSGQTLEQLPAESSVENRVLVENSLKFLHGTDDVILTSQSFETTFNCWLRHMLRNGYVVHAPEELSMVESDVKNVMRYSSNGDVEKQLKETKQNCPGFRSLVLVKAEPSAQSVRNMRGLCYTVERHFATVVLLDPEGLSLIRQIIGETKEATWILRRPTIIQATLNPLTGHDGVSYVTGSRKYVQSCRQWMDKQSRTLDYSLVQKITQAMRCLGDARRNFYTATLHSTSLRLQLESARVGVQERQGMLCVPLEGATAQAIQRLLQERGFLVALRKNSAGETELQFSVNGYHDNNDVTHFCSALLQELCNHNVISDAPRTEVPKISLALLNTLGGSSRLQEAISYDQVLESERAHKKTARLGAGVSKINNGYNTTSFSKHSNQSRRRASTYAAVKGTERPRMHHACDIRWLNEVYCWSERHTQEVDLEKHQLMWASSRDLGETDGARSADWRDDMMWAPVVETGNSEHMDTSCVDVEGKGQSEDWRNNLMWASPVEVQKNNAKSASNKQGKVHIGKDLRYLEDLYCSPMFDEQADQRLLQEF